MVTRDEVIATLQQAKERVAAGWTQGRSKIIVANGTTKYCMTGAIISVTITRDDLREIAYDMLKATRECRLCQDFGRSVEGHNDTCLVRQSEAIDWYDRAIAYCKQSSRWEE
jgi:hypothetical protein